MKYQVKEVFRLGSGGVHLGSRGRWIIMSVRPGWSIKQVPVQPRLLVLRQPNQKEGEGREEGEEEGRRGRSLFSSHKAGAEMGVSHLSSPLTAPSRRQIVYLH